MPNPSESQNPSVYKDFDDYHDFQSHQRLDKKEMFDEQFIDFMKWFKKDIHSRYSRKDFQAIERKNLALFIAGLIALFLAYLYLHLNFAASAFWWGIPLFIAALFVVQKGEVMHMRAHSPSNLTGIAWIDQGIDRFGLPLTGISPALFKRRHCAAHYNDIGNVSRIFSEVWVTFDQIPVNYFVRPWVLLKFLSDQQFCQQELINRRKLLVEIVGFYTYIAAIAGELCHGSYFLLVFHLIPLNVLAGVQILSAVIVHSGIDCRNSFESNGLFDYRTCPGLFKVPLWLYSLLGNGGIINHGIHHAYPQVPLDLINQDYQRLNQHILGRYSNVRYNSVLSMVMHKNLLDRLPPSNLFDYIVTLLISLLAIVASMITVAGAPFPPTMFELLLVDYRVLWVSTKAERYANFITFWDRLNLEERYRQAPNPNTYFRWVYRRYQYRKEYLIQHSHIIKQQF
jgi:fatty acid desaturase